MNKKQTHLRILDLDLDFFLNDRHTNDHPGDRLDPAEYIPWSEEKLVAFLQDQCGLDSGNPIQGKCFTTHEEVFYHLRTLIETSADDLTFEIDHVDAHADMGNWDNSYSYLATDLLALPIKERAYPKLVQGTFGLNENNYLMFIIANRWLTKLNYINRQDWADDIPWFPFEHFSITNDYIRLKQFNVQQMKHIQQWDMIARAKQTTPLSIEPPVAFKFIDAATFENQKPYDLILLTQSPYYTPPTSDELIRVIQSYMIL